MEQSEESDVPAHIESLNEHAKDKTNAKSFESADTVLASTDKLTDNVEQGKPN